MPKTPDSSIILALCNKNNYDTALIRYKENTLLSGSQFKALNSLNKFLQSIKVKFNAIMNMLLDSDKIDFNVLKEVCETNILAYILNGWILSKSNDELKDFKYKNFNILSLINKFDYFFADLLINFRKKNDQFINKIEYATCIESKNAICKFIGIIDFWYNSNRNKMFWNINHNYVSANLKILTILFKSSSYFKYSFNSDKVHQYLYSFFIKGKPPQYEFNHLRKVTKNCLYSMMNDSEYHKEMKKKLNIDKVQYDQYHDFEIQEDWDKYLNPEGFGLNNSGPNQENKFCQQYSLAHESWKSVIESIAGKGISSVITDIDNMSDPSGKLFNLFPFHIQNNQHIVFQDGKFYAKQNGKIVSIINGENLFQLIPSSPKLKGLQSFKTQFI